MHARVKLGMTSEVNTQWRTGSAHWRNGYPFAYPRQASHQCLRAVTAPCGTQSAWPAALNWNTADGYQRGLPSLGLSSTLAVLGGDVGCPYNGAAPPATSEEVRGRIASTHCAPFLCTLCCWWAGSFLVQSFPSKTVKLGVMAQVRGGLHYSRFGQGMLISWRAWPSVHHLCLRAQLSCSWDCAASLSWLLHNHLIHQLFGLALIANESKTPFSSAALNCLFLNTRPKRLLLFGHPNPLSRLLRSSCSAVCCAGAEVTPCWSRLSLWLQASISEHQALQRSLQLPSFSLRTFLTKFSWFSKHMVPT